MYDIFTYIWLIFVIFHVGKYTSPMDPMGMVMIIVLKFSPQNWGNISILTHIFQMGWFNHQLNGYQTLGYFWLDFS